MTSFTSSDLSDSTLSYTETEAASSPNVTQGEFSGELSFLNVSALNCFHLVYLESWCQHGLWYHCQTCCCFFQSRRAHVVTSLFKQRLRVYDVTLHQIFTPPPPPLLQEKACRGCFPFYLSYKSQSLAGIFKWHSFASILRARKGLSAQ